MKNKTEIYTVYAEHDDITFIMEDTTSAEGEPIKTAVVGWYYGEPTKENNRLFYGDLVAKYNGGVDE